MFSPIVRAVLALALCFSISTAYAVTAKICVDPGHGGTDSGAAACGLLEKNPNLSTGLYFQTWMNSDTTDTGGGGSWTVLMTRTTDVYVSLSARCTYANNNGANRFMSIHNNAYNGLWSGTETFSYSTTGNGADLRNKVQSRMLNAWGLTNRGNKTANFYVLKYTNMSAELVEMGFTDKCSPDAEYIASATHRNNAALGHLYALQNHFGLTAYKPGLPTYTSDSPSCSSNWSTGTSATDKYGSDYRYRSTAALSDAASWSITVGTSGTYKVQAWWPAGTNRSASAPYIVPDGSTVSVNQQTNGGKWNVLKSISLSTGAKTTQLSCWTTTGYVVIADAIRFGP